MKKFYLVENFLLPALNNGLYGQYLEWVDKDKTTFKVLYQHKNQRSWKMNSVAVFMAWDYLKGREGEDTSIYYTAARQRFKAAMYKCPKVKKISSTKVKDMEIYTIVEPTEAKARKKKIQGKYTKSKQRKLKENMLTQIMKMGVHECNSESETTAAKDCNSEVTTKPGQNSKELIIPDFLPEPAVPLCRIKIEPGLPVIHVDPVVTIKMTEKNKHLYFDENEPVRARYANCVSHIVTVPDIKSCGLSDDASSPSRKIVKVVSPNLFNKTEFKLFPQRLTQTGHIKATHSMPAIMPQKSRYVKIAPKMPSRLQLSLNTDNNNSQAL